MSQRVERIIPRPCLAMATRSCFPMVTGAKIVQKLTNYRWAYEMKIADADRHVLRFGSEPRTDLPLVF